MRGRALPTIESVRRGIACCFPDLTGARVRPVPRGETGWDSLAYIVGDSTIVKIARLPSRPEMFVLLRRIGPRLSKRLPLPIPVETHFSPRCRTLGVPIVGTVRVPGVQLVRRRFGRLDRKERESVARDLGRFLSALHRFPVADAKRAGARTFGRQGMIWVWDRVRRHVLPTLDGAQKKWVRELFSEHMDSRSFWRFPQRFIHGDLCDSHILVKGGRVSGIIDWGDAGIGDPAGDFGGLVMGFGERFAREAMRHYHAPSEGLIRRPVDFYLRTIPLQHIDFGTRTGQLALVRNGRKYLRLVMSGALPRW